jgi:hypothetical protein
LALGVGVGLGARADLGALFARLELDELGDEADLAVDVLRGGGGRGGGREGGARENGEPRQVSHGKVMVLQGPHRHRAALNRLFLSSGRFISRLISFKFQVWTRHPAAARPRTGTSMCCGGDE